jgi:6-hydroxymethylpterin diphosphokinase MptE-like
MSKESIKRIVPSPLWHAGSQLYWGWYNRGRHVAARVTSPVWARNIKSLAAYENIHAGKRAFIIGNGPSLKGMDLGKLQNEITFGSNRIYLMFPEIGFSTTYLVSVNDLVLEQCAAEMAKLDTPKWVTWRARNHFTAGEKILFLDSDYTGKEDFNHTSLASRTFEGFTVTYVALQIAYLMGIREAILIGVDHNFATKGPANSVIVSSGADPNHFSGSYFGPGFKWQLPDLDGSERAYRLARQAYEADGRKILDATVNGKLKIFDKVNYRQLFK